MRKIIPYSNRHRYPSGTHQGGWDNDVKGTLQIASCNFGIMMVTYGEPKVNMGERLFNKNTGRRKVYTMYRARRLPGAFK
jgi:hypothetical protein